MDDLLGIALPWLLTIVVIGCAGGLPLLLSYLHRTPRRSDRRAPAKDEAPDTSC